jgi:hypothetical protein
MLIVRRLGAWVRLDDPEPTLARAEQEAAAGDESWQAWALEYRRGEALIVRVEVTLEASVDSPDGPEELVRMANPGVFIEKDIHPAKVEQQIGELVSKDFPSLVRELASRGHDVDESALGEMYVHVELAKDVRNALKDAGAARTTKRGRAPASDIGLSRQERLG